MGDADLNVLVIRHETCSSLGMLDQALKDSRILCRYLETGLGETFDQPLETISHLVILGGPISVYEADIYPHLKYEFQLVEAAIARGIPTLGICLGSQILAHVLGANVYRGEHGREAGWCEMELTAAARKDPLFADFPQQFRVFESHQDTFDLPADAVHLAFSNLYPNQAFRYQNHVWSLQFHLEIDHNVLGDCRAIIEKELAESQIFDTTVEDLLNEAQHHSQFVAPLAHSLMSQFLQVRSPAVALSA